MNSPETQVQSTVGSALPMNVNTTERIISVMGGAYLLINALAKKEINVLKTMTAAFLLFRGITGHCPGYRAAGKTEIDQHPRNVNIRTSLIVNRPRHEVYGFWRRLENLPKFMKHLESVIVIDEKISEWKAGIMGAPEAISWRSEIVKDEPGALLSWHSLPGADIENAGKIEFEDADSLGTRINIVISYRAPLGMIGEKAARLINPVFKTMVKEDVENFKRHIESGMG